MRFCRALILLAFCTGGGAHAKTVVWGCTDCYSTASMLPSVVAEIAAGEGIVVEWVHIQTHKYSTAFEAHVDAFPKGTVRLTVDPHSEVSVDTLMRRLRELKVERIVNSTTCEGSYHGCQFSALLGTPDDPFASRDLRKKKKAQSDAAGQFGIPTHRLVDLPSAMDFVQTLGGRELVVKFDGGGAGFGLQYLPTEDLSYVRTLLERQLDLTPSGQFGQSDDSILQPRIVGEEYYAQTFTYEGVTYLTGLWKYYKLKIGSVGIYFIDRPVSLFSAEAIELNPIVKILSTRFGKQNGASHFELMKEASSGRWWLIEDNARLVGTAIPTLEKRIWGISQLELLALSLLNPAKMHEELRTFPRPMRGDGLLFMVPSPGDGVVNGASLETVSRLATFQEPPPQFKVPPGKGVGVTQDLQSAAMVLRFFGEPPQVRDDFEAAFAEFVSGRLIHPTGDCATFITSAGALFPQLEQRRSEVRWDLSP